MHEKVITIQIVKYTPYVFGMDGAITLAARNTNKVEK